MADILSGFNLLANFSSIFSFIFILIIVYAVAEYTKFFGDNKGIHAILALCIAVITLMLSGVIAVINLIVPWFALMFIFAALVIMAFKFFGVSDENLLSTIVGKDKVVLWWIVTIAAIIILGALGRVYFTSGGLIEPRTNESMIVGTNATSVSTIGQGAFWATLFHPKILGLILILLIASFTIRLLSGYENR
ncbi:MAG: hypothetical protein Q7J54_00720 [Candidatus Woesearchaeota archaeon]|nr:hypothetical protein [Candidatus Woesearchaeota archaeon]